MLVREAGGTVLRPATESGERGRSAAYIADPTGGTPLVIEPLAELVAALG